MELHSIHTAHSLLCWPHMDLWLLLPTSADMDNAQEPTASGTVRSGKGDHSSPSQEQLNVESSAEG